MSFGPASAEPTGAPSPLLKQTLTVSKCLAHSASAMPVAAAAFQSRAPSRCVRKPGLVGPVADGDDILVRLNLARPAVVRVFQADQPRADEVIVLGPDQAAELIDVQHAGLAFDRPGHDAAELGERPLLVVVDVAAGFADELVARLAVNPHADLVGHRPRRHEQGRLLAQNLRRQLLQPIAGRIDVDHVVVDLGIGHRLPHRGRGAGDGVGAEVDGGHGD